MLYNMASAQVYSRVSHTRKMWLDCLRNIMYDPRSWARVSSEHSVSLFGLLSNGWEAFCFGSMLRVITAGAAGPGRAGFTVWGSLATQNQVIWSVVTFTNHLHWPDCVIKETSGSPFVLLEDMLFLRKLLQHDESMGQYTFPRNVY